MNRKRSHFTIGCVLSLTLLGEPLLATHTEENSERTKVETIRAKLKAAIRRVGPWPEDARGFPFSQQNTKVIPNLETMLAVRKQFNESVRLRPAKMGSDDRRGVPFVTSENLEEEKKFANSKYITSGIRKRKEKLSSLSQARLSETRQAAAEERRKLFSKSFVERYQIAAEEAQKRAEKSYPASKPKNFFFLTLERSVGNKEEEDREIGRRIKELREEERSRAYKNEKAQNQKVKKDREWNGSWLELLEKKAAEQSTLETSQEGILMGIKAYQKMLTRWSGSPKDFLKKLKNSTPNEWENTRHALERLAEKKFKKKIFKKLNGRENSFTRKTKKMHKEVLKKWRNEWLSILSRFAKSSYYKTSEKMITPEIAVRIKEEVREKLGQEKLKKETKKERATILWERIETKLAAGKIKFEQAKSIHLSPLQRIKLLDQAIMHWKEIPTLSATKLRDALEFKMYKYMEKNRYSGKEEPKLSLYPVKHIQGDDFQATLNEEFEERAKFYFSSLSPAEIETISHEDDKKFQRRLNHLKSQLFPFIHFKWKYGKDTINSDKDKFESIDFNLLLRQLEGLFRLTVSSHSPFSSNNISKAMTLSKLKLYILTEDESYPIFLWKESALPSYTERKFMEVKKLIWTANNLKERIYAMKGAPKKKTTGDAEPLSLQEWLRMLPIKANWEQRVATQNM